MTAKKEKVVEKPVENVDNIGTQDMPIPEKVITETTTAKTVKAKSILKNTAGKEVPEEDYFYAVGENKGVAPVSFTRMCGYPVDREDLIEVFDRIFKPSDNFLFYKSGNKEVYLVIVPLKFSTSVGDTHESVDGDFQKHAISFIGEGSVNLDTLKMKLTRVLGFVDFDKR